MKVTVTINNKPVEIELTQAQVNAVKKASEKITDRIKNFEDVLNELGITKTKFDNSNTYLSKDEIAYRKIKMIAQVLNEGWTPTWTNSSEYKYFPYFEYKSGFGFSFSTSIFWYVRTIVGSRLVFKSRELSDYAGKQFQDIYKEFVD